MSFNYANAKKMRKKTRVERMGHDIAKLQTLLKVTAQAFSILDMECLTPLGAEVNWLVKQEEAEEKVGGGELPPPPDYIWNGGGNPVEIVAKTKYRVITLLQAVEQQVGNKAKQAEDSTHDKAADGIPTEVNAPLVA